MPPRIRIPQPDLYPNFRRFRYYSSFSQPPYNIAPLPHRRLVALTGHDASHFLQGLTTQNINHNAADTAPRALYSAFLNAAGRVLYDTILYPTRNNDRSEEVSWFIEVDESSAQDLAKHLKRYKLRAKVQVRLTEREEFDVKHAWTNEGPARPMRGLQHDDGKSVEWFRDPRANDKSEYGLQTSTVGLATPQGILVDEDTANQVSTKDYHIYRYLNGIAEGPLEIIPSQALPLESNMDILNGIDFRKGCYVGQELTIRTKHTGVVRKRILPVQLDPPTSESSSISPSNTEQKEPIYDSSLTDTASQIPHGTDIKAEGNSKRSVGKWLSGVGNVGLALCRLEPMIMGEGAAKRVFWVGEGEQRQKVRAFLPAWMDLKQGNAKEEGVRKL